MLFNEHMEGPMNTVEVTDPDCPIYAEIGLTNLLADRPTETEADLIAAAAMMCGPEVDRPFVEVLNPVVACADWAYRLAYGKTPALCIICNDLPVGSYPSFTKRLHVLRAEELSWHEVEWDPTITF